MRTVLAGAQLVDGTGGPRQRLDVVVDDDRITSLTAPGSVRGDEVVDLDGLVLAPGFIDPHTHYDAQITWDRDLTPSCWHGVTTVLMGNCGFGIAPTRPSDRGSIARTLENVEGMSVEALGLGIRWDFESFPEYLDAIAAEPLRLNVAALIGHTPVRLYAMGRAATERAATAAEITEMRRLVREAMDVGAFGFATSASVFHQGDGGRPVPSRFATFDEICELSAPLGETDRGVIAVSYGPDLFLEQFAELSRRTGRPVTWTSLPAGKVELPREPVLAEQDRLGGDVLAQIACRPIVMQITLADPAPFARANAFKEALAVSHVERAAVYRDPAWRERARRDMDEQWGARWGKMFVEETERHASLRGGPSLKAIAAERHMHPLDLLCDLALDEDLRTRFRVVISNDDEDELALLLKDPRTLLGVSDAGAHASQLCDACYSTHLLQHWVRERAVLTLEEAVWRLTGQPAGFLGLRSRGLVAPGMAADLVAFDPETVGVGDVERTWDFPGGADRLVAHSVGIEDVWVNGQLIRQGEKDVVGSRPGGLLRGGSEPSPAHAPQGRQ